jgi:hypothetical protein
MLPGRYRFLLAVASWFVPRPLRSSWRRQRERELWHWRAFLVERDRFSPDTEAEMVSYCWHSLRETVAERLHPKRVVRSPGFCLTVLALVLTGVLAGTGGFRASRAAPQPLPYRDPARIVTLCDTGVFVGDRVPVRAKHLALWQAQAQSFEGIAGYWWKEPSGGAGVEANFFSVLGVEPALGRFFSPGETRGAVISHRLWETRFARNPRVLGMPVEVEGRREAVIGVLPADFWFIRKEIDVWTPLAALPERLGAVGRLKPGVVPKRAEAEMRTILWKSRPPRGQRIAPYVSELQRNVRETIGPYRWAFVLLVVPLAGLALVRRLFLGSTTIYELFFAAKALLLFGALTAVFMEAAASGPLAFLGWPPGDRDALLLVSFALCVALGTVWLFHDQRRRCRHCLHPLSMPTTFGTHSSWLLDPAGTELLCDRGHGTLYVPDTHASTQKPEGWTALDDSWRDLFDLKK